MQLIFRYTFILIFVALILMYFKGTTAIIRDGGSAVSNIIGLLQGRRADGNGVVNYAKE